MRYTVQRQQPLTNLNCSPRYGVFIQDREDITLERSQTLAFSKTRNAFTMPAGNYEFQFEIPLAGLRFDTLVGPKHEYYTYRVVVTVQRWMWRDLVVSQPVSIYRYPKLDIGRGMPKVRFQFPSILCSKLKWMI